MDRDTIIRLAEEAGLEPRLWNHTDAFERFAELVAAHEREECAKAIDDSSNICAPGPVQTVLREQARCIRSRT
jgi:hypothetical protein